MVCRSFNAGGKVFGKAGVPSLCYEWKDEHWVRTNAGWLYNHGSVLGMIFGSILHGWWQADNVGLRRHN